MTDNINRAFRTDSYCKMLRKILYHVKNKCVSFMRSLFKFCDLLGCYFIGSDIKRSMLDVLSQDLGGI